MNRPLAIFAGGCGVVIGLYVILNAAFAVMPDSGKAIFLLGLAAAFAAGIGTVLAVARALNVNARPAPHESHQADVIDGDSFADYTPQPRRELVPVDDTLMVREDQIERTALAVYRTMYPYTAPTRTNIQKRFPHIKSNGFISSVQAYLAERHLVEGGGQGREYQWSSRDE